jgi:hypothetical protein
MPQIKPEYEIIDDFRTMSVKLVEKYPDVLDGVNAASIRCVAITNKDPKENKPLWELRAVPMPIRLDCPYSHYVIVNMADWATLDDKHKALLAFDVLCSISRDGDEKVVPFDLKDHSVVLRTVGVDYMKRADVPDILNDNIQWKKDS